MPPTAIASNNKEDFNELRIAIVAVIVTREVIAGVGQSSNVVSASFRMDHKPNLPFPESQEIGEEESACILDVEIDSANDGFALQSVSDDESKNDYMEEK
eukprot:15355657-Ditylum_brightwellii.AAC.3